MLLIKILFAAVLTEAITKLITKSEFFSFIREFMGCRLVFFDILLNCGYCFSVWSSFLVNSILFSCGSPILLFNFCCFNYLINFLFSVILVHRVSNYLHGFSDRFFDTNKDIRYVSNSTEEIDQEETN